MNKKNMIIVFVICLILSFFLIFSIFKGTSALSASSSPYLPKDDPLGSGVKNVYLVNVKDNYAKTDSGYLNSITYVDSAGNLTSNVFMDTFIFSESTLDNKIKAIKRLDDRVKEINNKNNSNIKINVIISVNAVNYGSSINNNEISAQIDEAIEAFKNAKVSNLKLIGFYWVYEDINNVNSTFSMVEYFNSYVHSKGYKTLWIPYVMNYNRLTNGDNLITANYLTQACTKYSSGLNSEACNSGNEYVVIDGVRIYRDELQLYGYKYGFDFVSIQSGYEFYGNNSSWNKYRSGSETTIVDRLAFTDKQAKKMKASVEVELDPDSSSNFSYYGYVGCSRYKEWLRYGLNHGWNNSINVYYLYQQFSSDFLNQGGIARSYYDATYKYANGTLTQSDIDKISCDRGYYSNYENVSKGRTYSTNAFKYSVAPNDGKKYGYNYVNERGATLWKEDNSKYCKYGYFENDKWTSSLYCDDGKKLTDGNYGISTYSKFDDWVSFSVPENTKPFNVTINLGSKQTSLSYFGIELNNHNDGGIVTFPRDGTGNIKVYVSNDNINYSYVGELSLLKNRNIFEAIFYELKLKNSVSGKYVKFEITYNGTSGYVFVSEVIVGKTSSIKFNNDKTTIDMNSQKAVDINYTMDNVTVSNLTISNSNSNVVSATLLDGKIHLVPIKGGTSVITLTDKRYGTKVSHTIDVLDEVSYKVYYNGNGATGENYDNTKSCDSSNKCGLDRYAIGSTFNDVTNTFENTREWKYNKSYNLIYNRFMKKGYKFIGWSLTKNGSVKYSQSEEVSNLTNVNGEIVTLYAVWEPITIKVQYHMNGGNIVEPHGERYFANTDGFVTLDNEILVGNYSYNQEITGSGLLNYNSKNYVNIRKNGYIAKKGAEWNTKKDGSGISIGQDETGFNLNNLCASDCTITLYVNWQANKVKVQYDMNGGHLISPHGDNFEENGDLVTLNGSTIIHEIDFGGTTNSSGLMNYNNPSYINIFKPGFKIVPESAWYVIRDNNKIFYSQDGVVSANDLCDASNNDCTVTLIANWIENKNRNKVTFNVVDGVLNGNSTLYVEKGSNVVYTSEVGSETGQIPSVSREGYTFNGWYTSTDKKIIDSNGMLVDSIDYILDGKWIINKDIVLYAQFKNESGVTSEDIFKFVNEKEYDVSNDVLKQVSPGMMSDALFNTITTNGLLNIINNDDNILTESIKLRTGYKLRVTFSTKILEYKISVKGDVLGTGDLSRDNAKKIAKHIIDKDVINREEFLLAADYDNDGKIKMSDVIKILREMKNN